MTPDTEAIRNANFKAIRQIHKPFLTRLEALAVQAIAENDWNDFYAHLIEFQSKYDFHGVAGIAIGEAGRSAASIGEGENL
ncbi:MAG: hypothetical protein AB1861_18100 [Cyanobacteriota bacterium]